jgi:hypothetical protein
MKKISLTALFILIISTLSIGQKEVDISWNEKYSEAFTNFIVSEDDSYLYTFSSDKNAFYIEKYSKKELALEKKTAIDFPNEREANLEFFISEEDKVSIFYSTWSKSERISTLYAFKVDLSGKVVQGVKEILTVNIPNKYSKGLFRNVRPNKNSSNYLVYHSYLDYTFDAQVVNFALVNSSIDIIEQGEKDFREEKVVSKCYFLGCHMDNSNQVYFVSRKKYDEEKDLYTSSLLKYAINGKTLDFEEEYVLQMDKESIEYPAVYFGEEDQIVFGAIRKAELSYSSDENENNYSSKGLAWMIIDAKSGKTILSEQDDFSKKQIEGLEYENTDGLSVLFEGIEILPTKDGYYFIAEERSGMYSEKIYYEFVGKNNLTTSSTSYEYRDILICKVDEKGSIDWLGNIKKTQGFVAGNAMDWYYDKYKFQPMKLEAKGLGFTIQKNMRTYLSYTAFEKDEKLYFIFNDGVSNFKGKGENNYIQFGFSYGIPTYAIIEKGGKANKYLMYKKPQAKVKMRAGLFYETKDEDYIIFSDKGKVNTLGKLLFK